MRAFEVAYVPLRDEVPTLGGIGLVPWDSETFGFNVGSYRPGLPGMPPPPPPSPADLRADIEKWMRLHQAELVSCGVPGADTEWMACLSQAGFAFVDMALLAFGRRLTTLPPARIEVREAAAVDHEPLVTMAGTVFSFGRYHTDARFPRVLADKRYRRWMRNALAQQGGSTWVFVSGPVGHPTGFVCATLTGSRATLTLAAVDPATNPGILGPLLTTSALHALVQRGARSVQARISAANTGIVDIYSSLGFAFAEAEAMYHLHAGGAAHLNPRR